MLESKQGDMMSEKKYKSNTYVECYCSKHEEVLVGMKLYLYMSVILIPIVIIAYGFMLTMNIPALIKLFVTGGVLLAVLTSEWPDYLRAKKKMLGWGHSEACSHRIAILAMLHSGIWSEFKIMKKPRNDKAIVK